MQLTPRQAALRRLRLLKLSVETLQELLTADNDSERLSHLEYIKFSLKAECKAGIPLLVISIILLGPTSSAFGEISEDELIRPVRAIEYSQSKSTTGMCHSKALSCFGPIFGGHIRCVFRRENVFSVVLKPRKT